MCPVGVSATVVESPSLVQVLIVNDTALQIPTVSPTSPRFVLNYPGPSKSLERLMLESDINWHVLIEIPFISEFYFLQNSVGVNRDKDRI